MPALRGPRGATRHAVRGLTRDERRALLIDPSAWGESLPDLVFDQLIKDGRGQWTAEGFEATSWGRLALVVCPEQTG